MPAALGGGEKEIGSRRGVEDMKVREERGGGPKGGYTQQKLRRERYRREGEKAAENESQLTAN